MSACEQILEVLFLAAPLNVVDVQFSNLTHYPSQWENLFNIFLESKRRESDNTNFREAKELVI